MHSVPPGDHSAYRKEKTRTQRYHTDLIFDIQHNQYSFTKKKKSVPLNILKRAKNVLSEGLCQAHHLLTYHHRKSLTNSCPQVSQQQNADHHNTSLVYYIRPLRLRGAWVTQRVKPVPRLRS